MPVFHINLGGPQGLTEFLLNLEGEQAEVTRNQVAQGFFYEPDVSQLFERVIRPGDTVFDVGANIGLFSVYAASKVGPSGRVVSFEPDVDNIAKLRANLALNQYRHVEVVEKPVSNHTDEIEFFINSDSNGGHAIWDPAMFPGNIRCQTNAPIVRRLRATTLDREMARLGGPVPKLIKVDTEGADQFVLEGGCQLFAERKVPFVVSELHQFGLQKLNCSQQSFRHTMERFGYSTFILYYNGILPKLVPAGVELQPEFIINVLFSTPAALAEYWPFEKIDVRYLGWNK
jgi:FkbM family methyltransferase